MSGCAPGEDRMSHTIGRMLDFSGRAGVIDYWRLQRPLLLVMAAGVIIGMGVVLSPAPHLLAALGLPLIAFALIATLALVVRRLHDRGRSGWWLLLFQGAPILAAAVTDAAGPDIARTSPGAAWAILALLLVGLGMSIWGFVEIGLRRGHTGDNRFGPPGV